MQFFRIVVAILCSALFGLVSAQADDVRPDVRIVIDISGSMKETDSQNLRRPALNLLTELLPDDARAGVWTFGRYVNMLVPLDQVDEEWRLRARAASPEISSVGLNTNLVGALEKALYETSPDNGYEQTVILLTDGRIDMDTSQGDSASEVNSAERQRLINEILPLYTANRVRIHTLALSDAADSAMLQQIAMETDGLALTAHTADDLMPAFLKAFDRAVPAEQVPLNGNTFQIDGSVREFTALIFRAPTSTPTVLVSPSGKRYSQASLGEDTRWHHDLNFDLITISQPEPGEWQVEADLAPDSRVQVLSDLKLSVTGLPGSLFSGVPVQLEMALENEGELVTEQTILQLTDVTLEVTAPDGRTGSKLLSDPENLPVDGIFRETLSRLTQPGEYRLEINAEGRTFQRRQVLTATLAEPLRVEVDKDIEHQVVNIRVYSESDMVDTSLSRVISRIASPDGSSVIYSMEFSEDASAWQIALLPDKGPGQYDVMLNIRGVSSSGMTFKSKPENILVSFPLVADESVLPEPSVLPLAGNEVSAETETTEDAAVPEAAPEPEVSEPIPEPVSEPVQP
ncbi:MAG: vWA domain-containing protein, partial [Thalassolituus sp.]